MFGLGDTLLELLRDQTRTSTVAVSKLSLWAAWSLSRPPIILLDAFQVSWQRSGPLCTIRRYCGGLIEKNRKHKRLEKAHRLRVFMLALERQVTYQVGYVSLFVLMSGKVWEVPESHATGMQKSQASHVR